MSELASTNRLLVATFRAAADDASLDGFLRDTVLPALGAEGRATAVLAGRRVVAGGSERLLVAHWIERPTGRPDSALVEWLERLLAAGADRLADRPVVAVFDLVASAHADRDRPASILRLYTGAALADRERFACAAAHAADEVRGDRPATDVLAGCGPAGDVAVVTAWTEWPPAGAGPAPSDPWAPLVERSPEDDGLVAGGEARLYEALWPPRAATMEDAAEARREEDLSSRARADLSET